MTTLTIRSNSAQAKLFIAYARSLPYVKVADKERTQADLKPAVLESMRKTDRSEGLTEHASVDAMFKHLGI
ncbi:MAG: hypothetical protein FWE30_08565 [Bacteroidales bacterium]|nr:hypothetical protein [Bacteroidales bacterium]